MSAAPPFVVAWVEPSAPVSSRRRTLTRVLHTVVLRTVVVSLGRPTGHPA